LAKKKKILICTEFTVPYTSGSGINAFYFGSFLKSDGYNVKILTLNWDLRYSSSDKNNNIHIIRIPYFKIKYLSKLISVFIVIPTYIYYLLKFPVVLLYGPMSGYKALILFGKILGKKIIYQSTSLEFNDIYTIINKNRKFRNINKWIFSKLFVYYSISSAHSERYRKIYGSRPGKLLEISQG